MEQRPTNSGFTLIEVALAILVVAIGVTASFSLFPEGLKLTRESVNATEVGLFADYVFQTIDVQCQIDAADEEVDSWNRNKDVDIGLANARTMMKNMGKVGANMLHKNAIDEKTDELGNKLSAQLYGEANKGSSRHEFYWVPQYFGLQSEGGNYAAKNFATYWTTAFTYTLNYEALGSSGRAAGRPIRLSLNVWPGNNGTNATHYVFAREILSIR
jgi:prepilin-type N-terminal cleavage/methylation domain-containing protein